MSTKLLLYRVAAPWANAVLRPFGLAILAEFNCARRRLTIRLCWHACRQKRAPFQVHLQK